MENPIKKAINNYKEKKQRKKSNAFLRATQLGVVTMYIPKVKQELVAIKVMTDELKDAEPIIVDREQLIQFLVLPSDLQKARKAAKLERMIESES